MYKIRWRLSLLLNRVDKAMNPVSNKLTIVIGDYISRDKAQSDADKWKSEFITPIIEKEIEYQCWPKGSNFIDFFDK